MFVLLPQSLRPSPLMNHMPDEGRKLIALEQMKNRENGNGNVPKRGPLYKMRDWRLHNTFEKTNTQTNKQIRQVTHSTQTYISIPFLPNAITENIS